MNTKLLTALAALLLLVGCGDDANQNSNLNNNDTQPVCGNGVVELGELCDDGSQNSDTAPNACRTTCRTSYCGDGVIDEGELCDGSNIVGQTCQTHGFTAGALACSPETCQFDTSSCSRCGDSRAEGTDPIQVHYEVCDGTDLRGQDCISIGQAQGVLRCTTSCTWNISGCVGGGPICGDGAVDGTEVCDPGQYPLCAEDCSSRCGDTVVTGAEECEIDGASWNVNTCNYDCTVPVCGDGICNGPAGETQASCSEDCGVCGDGMCDQGEETAANCPADCICDAAPDLTQCDGACFPTQTDPSVYSNPQIQYLGFPSNLQCCPSGPPVVFRYATAPDPPTVPVENCGVCGNTCAVGQYCVQGRCNNYL
jgi:hypothetical protein